MIDSSKLLSRTSNQSLSSRRVLVDLTIIKRDTVKIDSLLKERLVLTKVREGIMRQKREDDMRVERERQLEEKRDDDSANVDPKKKKKPKSILGNIIKFVLGGFLNIISKITFRILPRLPFLLKTIGRFTRFFGTILRGTFNVATSLIKFAAPVLKFAAALGVKIFFAIANVIGVIAASTTGFIANIIGTVLAPFTGALTRRGAARVTDSVRGTAVRTRQDIDPTTVEIGGRKIKKRFEKLSSEELAEELAARRRAAEQPLQMKTTDVLQRQKKIRKTDFIKKGFKSLEEEQLAEEKLLRKLLKGKGKFSRGKFLKIPDKRFVKDVKKIKGLSKIEKNQVKRLNKMSDIELREAGFDPNEIRSNLGSKAGRDAGADALLDAINDPKNTVKASKLVGKKGLSKLLFNIGGEALEQSVKQSIKASIGVIPILGDLIGVLLDVFLFGEPVGRALFKGIGSFALGALLGGVGLAIGGPVGTLLGSIIGGIAGDILGGIAYDLFFGRKPQAGGYSTVTGGSKEYLKGVSKTRTLQKFDDGGVVREYEPPSQVPFDKSTNLRSLAFYEKTQVGREVMVPIPIPIPSSKNQGQGSRIVINKTSGRRSAFSQHYRRG